jgi:hypothetical protein
MWKWIGGIAGAVLAWWLTQGAIELFRPKQPASPAPESAVGYSVTGLWNHTTRSPLSAHQNEDLRFVARFLIGTMMVTLISAGVPS